MGEGRAIHSMSLIQCDLCTGCIAGVPEMATLAEGRRRLCGIKGMPCCSKSGRMDPSLLWRLRLWLDI